MVPAGRRGMTGAAAAGGVHEPHARADHGSHQGLCPAGQRRGPVRKHRVHSHSRIPGELVLAQLLLHRHTTLFSLYRLCPNSSQAQCKATCFYCTLTGPEDLTKCRLHRHSAAEGTWGQGVCVSHSAHAVRIKTKQLLKSC